MVVSVIQVACPRLFLVVTRDQRGIESRDRLFDGCPLPLAVLILRYARLQASLVFVRPRVPNVLIAVCLGEEDAQADTTGDVGICRIEALATSNGRSQGNDVVEWSSRALRIGWRRLHDV